MMNHLASRQYIYHVSYTEFVSCFACPTNSACCIFHDNAAQSCSVPAGSCVEDCRGRGRWWHDSWVCWTQAIDPPTTESHWPQLDQICWQVRDCRFLNCKRKSELCNKELLLCHFNTSYPKLVRLFQHQIITYRSPRCSWLFQHPRAPWQLQLLNSLFFIDTCQSAGFGRWALTLKRFLSVMP